MEQSRAADRSGSHSYRLGPGESLSENRPDTRLEQSPEQALHQLETIESVADSLAPLSALGKSENNLDAPQAPDFAARVQASKTALKL